MADKAPEEHSLGIFTDMVHGNFPSCIDSKDKTFTECLFGEDSLKNFSETVILVEGFFLGIEHIL